MNPILITSFSVAALAALVGCATAWADSGPWPAASGLTAVADSASVTETNPAGMTRLKEPQAVGQFLLLATDSSDRISASGSSRTRESDDTSVYGIPSFYYVHPLNDRITLGASITVPGGFGGDYGNGPSRFLAEEWSLIYVAATPTIAYRLNEQWSLGAGLGLNYSNMHFENAVFNGLSEPEGRMELDADGFAVSYRLGILWEISDKTRIGLSYRSKVESELEGQPEFSGLTTDTENRFRAAGLLDRNVELGSNLPPAVIAGVFQQLPNGWDLAADLAWIKWSEFQLTEVTFVDDAAFERGEQYEDVWAGSLGISWSLAPAWRMGLGATYMESPTSALDRSYSFRISEMWMLGIGVSAELDAGHNIEVNLNYLDLGDGKVETQNLPGIGVVEAEYDKNRGVMLDVSYAW